MKISKLALIALLGGALAAFGCSDDSSPDGSGGTGGAGGEGGSGGISVIDPLCGDLQGGAACANGEINPIEACCDLPTPPAQEPACVGTESLTNPATCTATDITFTVQITELSIDGDCNSGTDLDSCGLNSCVPGGLAPGEGVDGVDNALTGLAPVLAGVGGNLGGVNQAFSDGLCGLTDDPAAGTCEGGDNAGAPCTAGGGECTGDGAKCNLDDDDCSMNIPPIEILFTIDANPAENCASVQVSSNGQTSDVILNLGSAADGAPACLSGTIGTIPLNIAGTDGAFGNSVVRMTVSENGLSDGMLSATVDEATASAIADALIEGGSAVVGQVLDINDDLSGDTSAACNALSMTLTVSGTVPALN